MKKIEDERLKIELLKDFKFAFIIENTFIIIVLTYSFFKNSWDTLNFQNPLLVSFMIGSISLSILAQKATAAIEDKPKISKSKLLFYFMLEILVFSFLFILIIPKYTWLSFICGGIIAAIVSGIQIYNNHYRF